ncbi:MAG: tRNA (guanosine(46)-N7)-methyltransferase TrmB, partial [Parvimonas micra]|nr:tRNA (guanosine(46)-N7)-methyltransferase TrmB [Parvimonas micra]
CILDLDTNAIVYATRKIRDLELLNVRAIPTNIEKIDEIFSENSISRIYINFCNPWPKKRHHKRRLTHPNFLAKYNKLLIEEGEIHFKTDDDDLFKASLEYFNENGFEVILITYDLANFDYPQNIETEYENKFKSLGIKIKFLIAKKK